MQAAWDAAAYAKSSSQQQRWARELLAKLALRGDERVLDVGCGDGKVSAEIASLVSNGGSVLGVDNSPDMVRFAADHFGHVPNLRFAPADARALAFAGEFDVVFSNAALHWVAGDHRPVLRGVAAALRPGGRALLQMGGRGNAATVLKVLNEVIARPHWSPLFDGFAFAYGFHGPDAYRPWVEQSGLRPVRVELIDKDMAHPDEAAFAGWFRTTWLPWTGRVPAERREAFIGEVVEAYITRHPPDDEGRVHVPMVRLEVEAVRP